MKFPSQRQKAESLLKRTGYNCGGMPMAKAIDHGHGRDVFARGGAPKAKHGRKNTHVNVIVAPQGGGGPPPGALPIARPPMMGAPPPGGLPPGGPPRPPMAPPAGGPPPGLGAPPGVAGPPPGGPPMLGPRKRGGRTSYPIDAGGGGAKARLEKAKAYG